MSEKITFGKTSNYMLVLDDGLKETQLYVQQVNIPSIIQNISEIHNQGLIIKKAGSSFIFSPVIINVIIDSEFKNYETLYKNFTEGHDPVTGNLIPSKKIFKMSLVILSSKNNPIAKFIFFKSIITDLGDIDLDITTTDNITCSLTVEYTYYDFKRIN